VWLRGALGCAILSVTAGCTQILGFDNDYYVVGQPSDSGAPPVDVSGDAGSGDDARGDSIALDSNVDSSNVDSARAPDGTVDGSDGAVPTFCQSLQPQPLFCEDFDEGVALASEWSYILETRGSLALYGSASMSPPASMQAMTDVVMSANTSVDTAVYEDFSLTGMTFAGSIDLDLRVDQVDSNTGTAVLAQFGLIDGSGNGQYYLQFVTNSNGANPLNCGVNEDYFATTTSGNPTPHPVSSTIPLHIWVHVRLTMTVPFSGGAGTATVRINGGATDTAPIQVEVANFTQSIGVGVLYASTPSNGWTVLVDNVVFNATTN
jgi:hypothetical protein